MNVRADARGASPIMFPLISTAMPAVLPVEQCADTEMIVGSPANCRRRVLAIMYQFPPSRAVGAQSCAQICRYLPAYGWDVTVLTVREQYIADADSQVRESFPGKVIRTGLIPHPLSLYRKFKGVGVEPEPLSDNTTISRSSLRKASALRQWLLSALCIPDLYVGWIAPAVISGLRAVREQDVRCLFSSGPWWTNHLVGWVLTELTGLPWIAQFRDSWAQGHWMKPVSNLSIRVEKALERQVLTKASAVVCVTDMQASMLHRANPELPKDKFVTIPNGYDAAEWSGVLPEWSKAASINKNRFVITYAGSLYHGRSPYPLFRALQSLIECGKIDRERIRVELLGSCDVAEGSRVMDVAATYGLADCVTTPGHASRPETLRRMRDSDLLLLLVDDQGYSIPAKTYEYLIAGRPILALTSGGAAVELLNQTGGAWIANPADTSGIKAAVMEAYECWRNGVDVRLPKQDVVAAFDRRLLAGRFAEVFNGASAVRSHHSPSAREAEKADREKAASSSAR